MASYIDCRVSFQIMSSQLNLLQYKLEKHLTDDQGKQDPPELNYECHGNMYLLPYNVKLSPFENTADNHPDK